MEQCATLTQKISCASTQLAAFLSLALEQAADTANSMRSRGYGLPGRSSYTTFRMDGFNAALLAVMAALGGLTLVSLALGAGVTSYFPGIALASGRWLWVGVVAECLLMGVPVVLNWKRR